jgi:hypothetical protein
MGKGTRYTLFFGTVRLGEVMELDADFPNLSGSYLPHEEDDFPDTRARIRRLWDLSIAWHDASMKQDEAETDRLAKEEEDYLDLIESDNWYLQDQAGKRTHILVPTFCAEDEIVWRYHPSNRGEGDFPHRT